MKTRTITAAVVAVLAVGLAGCSGDDEGCDPSAPDCKETSSSGQEGGPDAEPGSGDSVSDESDGGSEPAEEVAFGETATLETDTNKFTVSADGPRPADIDDTDTSDGVYVAFDVEITSLEGKVFQGSTGFTFVAPDGEEHRSRSMLLKDANNEETLDMSGPDEGQTVTGAVVFEIPKNHDGYVLHFEGRSVSGDNPAASWS